MHIRFPRALPSLDGVRGQVVRGAFVVLGTISLLIFAASLVFNGLDYFRNMPSAGAYGFMTQTDSARGVVIGRTWAAAEAHGLRAKDRIIGVEGRALPPQATEFDVGAALAHAGPRTVLSIERGHVPMQIALDRQASGWTPVLVDLHIPLWLYSSFSYFTQEFSGAFFLVAALLLFLRRPRDPEAMLFAFGFLFVWMNNDVIWWTRPVLGVPKWLEYDALDLGWTACLLAVASFPDGRFASRWAQVSAVVTFVGLFAYHFAIVYQAPNSVTEWLIFGLELPSLFAILARWRATRDQMVRQQIKWAMTGFGVTIITAVVPFSPPGIAAMQALGQPYYYFLSYALTMSCLTALPAGLLVSLLRYRLYDADTAISRSVAYGVLTLGLLAIFAGSEKIIEVLGEEYFGESLGALAGGLGAAVAAVLVAPMHHRVMHWAEHRFQKGLVHLRHGLPLLVGDLRETASLDEIAEAVLSRVRKGVRAGAGAVIVEGQPVRSFGIDAPALDRWLAHWTPRAGEALDCDRGDALLPMRVPLAADGCGTVGWLLLGPRPDGSFYAKAERETLAEIADPVARALQIARRREASHAAQENERASIWQRLEGVERALARLTGRDSLATGG